MTKLSRKVEYALMVLKHMAEKGNENLICAKDISDVLHTPFEVTAKIMQTLVSGQILRSEKGLQGGYRLAKSMDQISLHQLVELIEGPSALVKCIHSEQACEIQTNCNVASPLTLLNEKLQGFFQEIYLSDLFKNNTVNKSETEVMTQITLKQNLYSDVGTNL